MTDSGVFEHLRIEANWPREQPHPRLDRVGRPARGLELALDPLAGEANPIIVEVGAEFGGSTRRWLESLPLAKVISIDPWPDTYPTKRWPEIGAVVERGATVLSVFQSFCWEHRDRLAPMRGTTPSALRRLYDLRLEPTAFYVDGDHRYEAVFQDLVVIDSLFPTSMICGDDWNFSPKAAKYRGMGFPVRWAVQDYCAFMGYGVESRDNTWLVDRQAARGVPEPRQGELLAGPLGSVHDRLQTIESTLDGLRRDLVKAAEPGLLRSLDRRAKRTFTRWRRWWSAREPATPVD